MLTPWWYHYSYQNITEFSLWNYLHIYSDTAIVKELDDLDFFVGFMVQIHLRAI